MLNRWARLPMSTSVLEALPGKLDIKRHSTSILYLHLPLSPRSLTFVYKVIPAIRNLYYHVHTIDEQCPKYNTHTTSNVGVISHINRLRFETIVDIYTLNNAFAQYEPPASKHVRVFCIAINTIILLALCCLSLTPKVVVIYTP